MAAWPCDAHHAVYDTLYHLVWSPKYRRDVLQGEIQQRVRELFADIAEQYDITIEEMEVGPIMSIFFVPSRHGTPSLKWSPLQELECGPSFVSSPA